MALKLDANYKGILVADAYYRISFFSCSKDIDGIFRSTINVVLSQAKDAPLLEEKRYIFDYDITSADNAIVQGYTFLKTLPDFALAVDV